MKLTAQQKEALAQVAFDLIAQRRAFGWTQKKAAEHFEVNVSTYRALEKGERKTKVFHPATKYFDVTVPQILKAGL